MTEFLHAKPANTAFLPNGSRDFFSYRDLGVAEDAHKKVIAHLVKGWARCMYDDKETLVEAGDMVHQRPGISHYLFDYSPDIECLEIGFATELQAGRCGAGVRHSGAHALDGLTSLRSGLRDAF